MMTFKEFLSMDGYGFYIWTSYAIGALTFLGLLLSVKLQHKKLIKFILTKKQVKNTNDNKFIQNKEVSL